MTRNTSLIWRLSVASLSMLAAVAVYSFARIYPPEILEPLQATSAELTSQAGIFGSAPSFFYTLSLGLVIGACASSKSSARFHCLIWIGLALFLELSQHPVIAESISDWTRINLPTAISTLIDPYWSRGIFDPLDLLASLLGGSIALYLLTLLLLGKSHIHDY